MAGDATTLLIQRILSQLSQSEGVAQNSKDDVQSQLNVIIGTAANYAQLLGTVESPIAAYATAKAVAAAQAAGTGDAAAQAAAVAGAAGAAGSVVGGVIILAISAILAMASNLGASDIVQQELQRVENTLQDIQNVALSAYWGAKLGLIANYGVPLQTDLDFVDSEGLFGAEVKNSVTKFITDATAFVNNLIPTKNIFNGLTYWQRPYVSSLQFDVQDVPYVRPFDYSVGWYGNLPQPPQQTTAEGATVVPDPRSILPDLSWGIGSYLTVWALANLIDPTQPTFKDFLAKFQSDELELYAIFFRSQVEMAIGGLTLSDIPSNLDVLSFLNQKAHPGHPDDYIFPEDNEPWWGGSAPGAASSTGCPSMGQAWNGIYGVVDEYGAYPAPVAVPSSSPAHLIDLFNTDGIVDEFIQAWDGYDYVQRSMLGGWVLPWVYDRLILGQMARWKALYLINGYDKAWSTLQSLCSLAKQPPPPRLTVQFSYAPVIVQGHSFIASENWSARELCAILNVDGYILEGVKDGSLKTVIIVGEGPDQREYGYSLWALVQTLDNIANGNWAGTPGYSSHGNGPTRPLGLRERLAKAAV